MQVLQTLPSAVARPVESTAYPSEEVGLVSPLSRDMHVLAHRTQSYTFLCTYMYTKDWYCLNTKRRTRKQDDIYREERVEHEPVSHSQTIFAKRVKQSDNAKLTMSRLVEWEIRQMSGESTHTCILKYKTKQQHGIVKYHSLRYLSNSRSKQFCI